MMRVLVLWLGIVLLFSGCWSVAEPNRYDAYVINRTSDSLCFLNNGSRDISTGVLLAPNESYLFKGQPDIDNEEDPVRIMFDEDLYNYQLIVEILQNDSVLVTWEGPGRYMGESINHFYNYDSWKVSFERGETGLGYYTLEFFIGEEDLQGN